MCNGKDSMIGFRENPECVRWEGQYDRNRAVRVRRLGFPVSSTAHGTLTARDVSRNGTGWIALGYSQCVLSSCTVAPYDLGIGCLLAMLDN